MSTSLMKKLTLIMILAFMAAGSVFAAKSSRAAEEYDSQGRRIYWDDQIAVVFKADTKLDFNTKSMDRTGIAGVDAVLNDFRIDGLERFFKVKAPAKGSALPDLRRIYRVRVNPGTDVHSMISRLNQLPSVEVAERVPIMYQEAVPNDTYYSDWLYHLPQIKAEEAWDVHKGEDGAEEVVVSIVDTGIDWNHEDLADNIWNNLGEDADGDGKVLINVDGVWMFDPDDENGVDDDGNGYIDDFIGWNMFADANGSQNNDPMDPENRGHGSHCAGLSAGVTNNGVGIAAISYNIKVMGTSHGFAGDNGTSIYNAYQGIIYSAENGADVINTSWGGSGYSSVSEMTIAYCTGLGSIIVSSAGNGDNDAHAYPSDYPGVISVASVDRNDGKAWYSTYGIGVDVSAPGGNHEPGLLSTVPYNTIANVPGYDFYSGTSMASPVVVGLVGLIKSANPGWTNEQIITQLIGTTDNINTTIPSYIDQMGSGRVNAYRALTETEVTPPAVMEIELWEMEATNSQFFDGQFLPGDSTSLDFVFRSYSHFVSDNAATFTLTTDDPDIIITKSTFSDTLHADDYSDVPAGLAFKISDQTTSHSSSITLTVESDGNRVIGGVYEFEVVISTVQSSPGELDFNITYGDGDEMTFDIINSGVEALDFLTAPLEFSPPYFHLSETNAYEGLSWFCTNKELGVYEDLTLQFMALPALDLKNAATPELSFVTAWDIESPAGASSPHDGWDGAAVWITTDDFETFQVLTPIAPAYTASSLFAFDVWGYGANMPGWAGNSSGWQNASFDLSAYVGDTVNVVFAFASDQATVSTGWWLDNISITDGASTLFENSGSPDPDIEVQGTGGTAQIADWITLSAESGNVAANSSQSMTISIETMDLENGSHSGAVLVALNDEFQTPVATIPVNLFVAAPEHDLKVNNFMISDEEFVILQPKAIELTLDNRGANDETDVEAVVTITQDGTEAFRDTVTVASFLSGTSVKVMTDEYLPLNGGDVELAVSVLVGDTDYNDFNNMVSGMVEVNNVFEDFKDMDLSHWEFVGMGIDTGTTGIGDIYTITVDKSGIPYGPDLNNSATYLPGVDVSQLDHGALSFWAIYSTQVDADVFYVDLSTDISDDNAWEQRAALSGKQTKIKQFKIGVNDLIEGGADRIWFRFRFESDASTQIYGFFVDNIGFYNENFTSIDEGLAQEALPASFELKQNYPNPFNPVTTISYGLPEISDVNITVFNIRGETVASFSQQAQPAGWHSLRFNGRDMFGQQLPSGVYIYRISGKNFVDQKKMLLLK